MPKLILDFASGCATSDPQDRQILGGKVVEVGGVAQTDVLEAAPPNIFFKKFADFWWDDDIFLRVKNFSKFSKFFKS